MVFKTSGGWKKFVKHDFSAALHHDGVSHLASVFITKSKIATEKLKISFNEPACFVCNRNFTL